MESLLSTDGPPHDTCHTTLSEMRARQSRSIALISRPVDDPGHLQTSSQGERNALPTGRMPMPQRSLAETGPRIIATYGAAPASGLSHGCGGEELFARGRAAA